MANIVPISAHVHYDDVQALWSLKISRMERDPGNIKPYQKIYRTEPSLTNIVLDIYTYWAASPTGEDYNTVAAEVGSAERLTEVLAGLTFWEGGPTDTGIPSDDYPGPDPDLDPDPTDFGVTEE